MVGQWLRARRDRLGRTLRVAAKIAGCSDAWLCQIETGYADLMSIKVENIPKIALAYAISATDLLRLLGILPVRAIAKRKVQK